MSALARTTLGERVRCGVNATALSVSLGVSALLMALALGVADCAWLAWISLLPFFWAIRRLTPRMALLSGSLWGTVLYSLSLTDMVPAIQAGVLSLLLLAIVPGTNAYLGSLLMRRIGFSPFVLAVGWIGLEFALRPLTLDNGQLGRTQGNGILIQRVGGLFGYVFVAFLIAYVNVPLLAVLSPSSFQMPSGKEGGAASASPELGSPSSHVVSEMYISTWNGGSHEDFTENQISSL